MLSVFLLYISCILFFFPFVTEKDEKTCLNAEKEDFDQRMACEAPVRWSKYTTVFFDSGV